jgi:transposase InsO family protein
MQERQKLAYRVLHEGVSVAAAAREAGVSRPTAYLWLERAEREGIANVEELSRRPRSSPGRTISMSEARCEVLSLKKTRPSWGAKKLHQKLWPVAQPGLDSMVSRKGSQSSGGAPVCVRTVDRWLKAAGMVAPRPPTGPWRRFEREASNQLWQVDFKGIEVRWGYRPMTILDDCSRYNLCLEAVVGYSVREYWPVLWQVMGEHGMPDGLLCDNGDGFNSTASLGLTLFQVWLWRLGIETFHGRPYHPQTQGKIERFHRTLEDEWHCELRQPNAELARMVYRRISRDYNWERPHEALDGRVPGAVYSASTRVRPQKIPEATVSAGATTRKVNNEGRIRFKGNHYRLGKGMAQEPVELREEEQGWAVYFSGRFLSPLIDMRI